MDRNLAVARASAPSHLRLAEAPQVDVADGPTQTFSPEPSVRGGGAETAVIAVSEPAPAVPTDARPVLDPEEIDADDVAEILEGRLDLVVETDPNLRARRPAAVDRTMVSNPNPPRGNTQPGVRMPMPAQAQTGNTAVGAPAAAAAPTSGTVVVERPILRVPAGGTVVREMPTNDAPAGTQIVATILVAPVAAPVVAEPVLGVPSPIAADRTDVQGSPVTAARVIVAGRYLEGGNDLSDRVHGVGTSFLLARTPTSAFADDPYVDAQHGALTFRPDGVAVEDFDSTNGLFVRVRGRATLRSGDMFRAGEELLRFTMLRNGRANGRAPALGSPDPGYWGRIDVMVDADEHAASYPVDDVEVGVGQTDGHLQFPDDEFLGELHCTVIKEERGATLVDHGSPCGTWLRLRAGDVVPYGSELLVGQTRVRIERE